ncbi:MAG: hypothetical protein HYX85_00340 [Chloroflexi bacterium]|nr:hypothetical protein [Chloroflexota bacterium]
METPNYIKALLKPNGNKPAGRKVWSVDLETVWLPFFTATNAMAETAIEAHALGAPLRLAYDKDGAVKFSPSGRPVIRVAKELADSVRVVRENFTANLQAYTHGVATENADGYRAMVAASQIAGKPIADADKRNLSDALLARMAETLDGMTGKPEAEADQPETSPPAETEHKAKRGKVAVPA